MENKIIPLNIVFTYPVHWKTFQIFRDYIQNFYDSVPCDQWYERFHYEFHDNTLSMRIEDQTFNYEWLLHIGASTKTNSDQKHAGYFGEGFKIASLCALRDKHWEIRMSSGNWSLRVIHTDHVIDGKNVQMLAYDLTESEISISKSELILQGLSNEDFYIFKIALKSFYYPENELLGEKIWEDYRGAIYTRSNEAYDSSLPYNEEYGRKGIIFCGFQIRGSLPFDLVVCLHDFKQDDRERKNLFLMDTVTVLKVIAMYLSPKASMKVLEKMRRKWITNIKDEFDFYSWAPVIEKLISRISSSTTVSKEFNEKYPNLLTISIIKSIRERNLRAQARSWLESFPSKYVLVGESFRKLGYNSLEHECECHGGLVHNDYVYSDRDNNCFKILEDLCKDLYKGFFLVNPWPERRFIINSKASYHGMAALIKDKSGKTNNHGLPIRYSVQCVFLKKTIFKPENFFDGVATYIHELCHMFGGDSSETFSRGLTAAMEIILKNTDTVQKAQKKWLEAF